MPREINVWSRATETRMGPALAVADTRSVLEQIAAERVGKLRYVLRLHERAPG
jgi:hypothetical protein